MTTRPTKQAGNLLEDQMTEFTFTFSGSEVYEIWDALASTSAAFDRTLDQDEVEGLKEQFREAFDLVESKLEAAGYSGADFQP